MRNPSRRPPWIRPARLGPDEGTAERGFALIATMIVALILITLLTLVFEESIQTLPLARQNQNYQAALQAAEAGVADYVNRLDANTAYFLRTTDATNPAMAPASGQDAKWAPVCPASSNCSTSSVNEWYSYSVNSTGTESNGTLQLTVSGAAGAEPPSSRAVIRTIKEQLSLASNDSSLYYTEYELEDPALVTSFPLSVTGAGVSGSYEDYCVYQAWKLNTEVSTPGHPYYGPDEVNNVCAPYLIYFIAADTLDGPIASNDEFNICGAAAFPDGADSTYDLTQSPNNQTGHYVGPGVYNNGSAYNAGCTGTPTWPAGTKSGTEPAGADESNFPTTNTTLEQDLSVNQDGGGCYYQGPITLTLNPPNTSYPSGSMTVTLDGSATASAEPSGITTEAASQCVGTQPYPDNGLIYDDNLPAPCVVNCSADVYVNGENAYGPITIGSAANITITNDIIDANTSSTSSDVVGLWAQNQILLPDSESQIPGASTVLPQVSGLIVDAAMVADHESIYLPCWTTDDGQTLTNGETAPSTNAYGCPSQSTNPSSYSTTVKGKTTTVNEYFNTVAGSLPSNTSFADDCNGASVQPNQGEQAAKLGFLTICGSLAQTYRGPVGTHSGSQIQTGYGKNYVWDQRLQYLQPPYFNAVTTPNWSPTNFVECNAAANPTTASC